MMIRLAMFVSGSGTTAEAIWNAHKTGFLKGVKPVLLVASNEGIGAIERLKGAGFRERQIVVIKRVWFGSDEEYGQAILAKLRQYKVNLVGLYGWLPLLPVLVVRKFAGRAINQHPGPLDPPRPDFGGQGMYRLRVHIAVHRFMHNSGRNVFFTEATAQRVALGFDQGEVIERETMFVPPDWSPEKIQQELLPREHRTQIRALQAFACNGVQTIKRPRPLISEDELEIWREAVEYGRNVKI